MTRIRQWLHLQEDGFPEDAEISKINGNIVTITGSDDFEMKLNVSQVDSFTDVKVNLVGFGAMDTQIGANEGQLTCDPYSCHYA